MKIKFENYSKIRDYLEIGVFQKLNLKIGILKIGVLKIISKLKFWELNLKIGVLKIGVSKDSILTSKAEELRGWQAHVLQGGTPKGGHAFVGP